MKSIFNCLFLTSILISSYAVAQTYNDLTDEDLKKIKLEVKVLNKFLPASSKEITYEGQTPSGKTCSLNVESSSYESEYSLQMNHPDTDWQYDRLRFEYGVQTLDTNTFGIKVYGVSTSFNEQSDSLAAKTSIPMGHGHATTEVKIRKVANGISVKMRASRSLFTAFSKWYTCVVEL